jgi:hypothetical protein
VRFQGVPLAIAAALVCGVAPNASAAEYPDRPIRWRARWSDVIRKTGLMPKN